MPDYKRYFNSGFHGCAVLAYARDPHRGRDVTLWALPDIDTVIGISDGTDAWVANTGHTLGHNTADLMRKHRAGELPPPAHLARRERHKLVSDEPIPPQVRTRVRIQDEQPPTRAKRVSLY